MLKKKNIKATEDFALNKSKEQMELKTRQKAKASVNAQKLFPKESHFMHHICGFMRKGQSSFECLCERLSIE